MRMIVFDPKNTKDVIERVHQRLQNNDFDLRKAGISIVRKVGISIEPVLTINQTVYALLSHTPLAIELYRYSLQPNESFDVVKRNDLSGEPLAYFRTDHMSLETAAVTITYIIEKAENEVIMERFGAIRV